MYPADACGNGRSTSVGCFRPVDVDVVVSENATTYRRHAYGLILNAEFFYHFCDEFVHNPVGTSRAIVHHGIGEKAALFQNKVFFFYNIFCCNHILILF